MAGWHHRCNEHELGQTLGDGEGQGGLVCCSPWGQKELDPTGRLNNNNLSTSKYNSPPMIKALKYQKGYNVEIMCLRVNKNDIIHTGVYK